MQILLNSGFIYNFKNNQLEVLHNNNVFSRWNEQNGTTMYYNDVIPKQVNLTIDELEKQMGGT